MIYYDMVFLLIVDVIKKFLLYMYVYVNGLYLYVYRYNVDEVIMVKWCKYISICIILIVLNDLKFN